jgi:hypothetical protein
MDSSKRPADVPLVEVYDVTDLPLTDRALDEVRDEPSRSVFASVSDRGRWAVVAATALVIGLVIGFVAGNQHGRSSAGGLAVAASLSPSTAKPSPSTAASPSSSIRLASDTLDKTGNLCGTQTGPREIQLGIEVANVGKTAVSLDRLSVVLPLGGLRPESYSVGLACGQTPALVPVEGYVLPATRRVTLLVVFEVLGDGCPAALPVDFRIIYSQGDGLHFASLTGFKDLADVPFEGC